LHRSEKEVEDEEDAVTEMPSATTNAYPKRQATGYTVAAATAEELLVEMVPANQPVAAPEAAVVRDKRLVVWVVLPDTRREASPNVDDGAPATVTETETGVPGRMPPEEGANTTVADSGSVEENSNAMQVLKTSAGAAGGAAMRMRMRSDEVPGDATLGAKH